VARCGRSSVLELDVELASDLAQPALVALHPVGQHQNLPEVGIGAPGVRVDRRLQGVEVRGQLTDTGVHLREASLHLHEPGVDCAEPLVEVLDQPLEVRGHGLPNMAQRRGRIKREMKATAKRLEFLQAASLRDRNKEPRAQQIDKT
jgi:hypothetical protein